MEGFERVQQGSSSGNRRMQVRIANHKILLSDDIAESIGPVVDLFVNRADDFVQIAIVRGKEYVINQNLVRKQRGFVNCQGFLRTLAGYGITDEWRDVESVDGGIVITCDLNGSKDTKEVQVDVERA